MTEKKVHKHPFLLFLVLLSVIFFLITAIGLRYLSDCLEDFEATLPDNLFNEYYDYFKNGNTEKILEFSTGLPETLNDTEGLNYYFEQKIHGDDLIFYYASNHSTDTPTYIVATETNEVATISLQKTGEFSRHGFDIYEVNDISYFPFESFSINSVSGIIPVIDGVPVDDSFEKTETVQADFENLPDYEIMDITYTSDNFNYYEEISFVSEIDSKCEITVDEETGIYSAISRPLDEEIEPLSEFAMDYIKNYARLGAAKNAAGYISIALADTDVNSDIYSKIRNYDSTWSRGIAPGYFEKEKVSDFYKHDTDVYTVKTEFIYHMETTSGEQVYPLTYELYIVNTDAGYKVFSLNLIQE